jgi:hypothetical protein
VKKKRRKKKKGKRQNNEYFYCQNICHQFIIVISTKIYNRKSGFNVLRFIFFQLKSKRFAIELVELRHPSIQKVVLGQQCVYQWDPEN